MVALCARTEIDLVWRKRPVAQRVERSEAECLEVTQIMFELAAREDFVQSSRCIQLLCGKRNWNEQQGYGEHAMHNDNQRIALTPSAHRSVDCADTGTRDFHSAND